MLRKFKIILAVGASFFVAACGGGGGSDATGPQTSTDTFQIKTAITNYVVNTQTRNATMSGTVNGVTVSGSAIVTDGALNSALFEGKSAFSKATTVTGSILVNGTQVPLATTSIDFFDNNYLPIGSLGSDYSVVRGVTNLPLTAKVGDTAILYVADTYTNSSKAVVTGTETVSYVMEPDTSSTALLSLISTYKNTSGGTASTDTVKLRITPSGSLTWLSETSVGSGSNLTATY